MTTDLIYSINGVVPSKKITINGFPIKVPILVESKAVRIATIIKINKNGVANFKKLVTFVF